MDHFLTQNTIFDRFLAQVFELFYFVEFWSSVFRFSFFDSDLVCSALSEVGYQSVSLVSDVSVHYTFSIFNIPFHT